MNEQIEKLIEKKTIGEVERIVHGSGLWDGTGPVEFSNDGIAWTETWAPTAEHPLPEFARVEVYRKDVRIPTRVTIRWDEQVPRADAFWAAKWVGAPMRHFGRTARMVGMRQTFRELLGDIVIEDEADDRTTPTTSAAPSPAPAPRDWAVEIAGAQSLTLLEQIEKDARARRVFTADGPGTALHRQLRDRKKALASEPVDAWATGEYAVDHVEDLPTEPNNARAVPRDFLPPANRAERRKAARKKGGKR